MVNKYDILCGKKVQFYRKKQNLNRLQIANKIGVTQQQLQKYEHSINRISVGKLYEIAQALNVKVSDLAPDE